MSTHSQSVDASGDVRGRRSLLARARMRGREDAGFTLIELLVVILIIGLLAAIAIPIFLSDTGRAKDAQAKELVHSAQTTAESYATGTSGDYSEVSTTKLHELEPAIPIVASESEAYLRDASGRGSEYKLTVVATNGDELSLTRNSAGETMRTCNSPIEKTGCDGAESGSW